MKGLSTLLAFLLVSCNVKTESKSSATIEPVDADVALKFINAYVAYCNENNTDLNSVNWIESNELTTDQFKMGFKEIIEEATRKDPEMGLGFDPIFDAQDYPEKGFEFLKSDDDGYVRLKGIDWPDFTVAIKIKLVGEKWMVDGAGMVNVPIDKRAKR